MDFFRFGFLFILLAAQGALAGRLAVFWNSKETFAGLFVDIFFPLSDLVGQTENESDEEDGEAEQESVEIYLERLIV